ncbi:MAG: pantoate--beta-alanine ligase [Thermotogota bacterium]|nr:pantoate--beta-alanine ligase [Thermotogota bacterium]
MKIVRNIKEMTEISKEFISNRKTHGLVPTMGYLHEGHLSLVRQAVKDNDCVTTSVFVNPTQFGPNEDFESYPRNEEKDINSLQKLGVDYVFAPTVGEMYFKDHSTYVLENKLSKVLCGEKRPGHFKGVTTVVSKLLNIIKPTRAYFGQKDAQQFRVIRKMVRDLNFTVELVEMPIIREKDGLAMSSRNIYLTNEQRREAPLIHKALLKGKELIKDGKNDVSEIKDAVKKIIGDSENIKIDYIEIVDEQTLNILDKINDAKSDSVIIAIATFVGKARLIDNEIVYLRNP